MGYESTTRCHVVAMPFPGRGHINPMLNFCKLLISLSTPSDNAVITFIVTEEWHGLLGSVSVPANIRLTTIPNVIPSEVGRGKDWPGFIQSTFTNMEAPVEQLLDQIELPKPSVIIYDTYLKWVVELGNRRNIPLASFWTECATVLSILLHSDLLVQYGHDYTNFVEKGNEEVKYIPGVAPICFADLPTPLSSGEGREVLAGCLEAITLVSKAQYLLITSVYEFETQAIESLRKLYQIPVYAIGPAIPPLFNPRVSDDQEPEYLKWLHRQPKNSVLYISQGSFLSASSAQLDELVAGVYDSGVRFFWVAREDASRYEETGGGDRSSGSSSSRGMMVPWCDQLRVLSHSSVGGFLSHCGWNSTKEAVHSGLPILSFPIFWDQPTNAKLIVDDWKIGRRLLKRNDEESLVTRQEIAETLQSFMDLENEEGKEMRRRAKELQKICQEATGKGGSSRMDLEAFLHDISYQRS